MSISKNNSIATKSQKYKSSLVSPAADIDVSNNNIKFS